MIFRICKLFRLCYIIGIRNEVKNRGDHVLKITSDRQDDRLWQILLNLSLFLTDRSHMRQSMEYKNIFAKLAEQLQLSPGTVSEAVEKLVRKQMLDRTVCPTDRRSVHIRVSEQGMEAINLGIDQLRKDQKALLELLSEEETQTLLRLLTKLAENVPDLTAKPV